ncbi:putative nuclease HARBI1 [Contarinia nasturtii]|uniref:putative nuclease HARBI1 n=1 Tax=Contarinia nasturtii TaxID=265458 RepID=UPI0012D49C68|nr:putative nuclease HARBI1 [Contarinia nasturtii]
MDTFTDNEFRRRFRLSKNTVQYLYTLIGDGLEPLVTRTGFTLSGLDKILITLRYYASASYNLVTADFYGVSETSVRNIIPVVSDKIAALRERFIRMPTDDLEIDETKRAFFRVAGMPTIIGAIDGTLVKIQEVGGAYNKTMFFCRKQFYAINTQIVCDANAKVLDIVARWPGSIHDETIFLNSLLFERFLNGEFNRQNRQSILLGDGGYSSETFLATPLRETNQQNRTPAEVMYQRAHIATRNVVERFNGQWKKRFPCLWIGMRFRKLETTLDVIVATAVLHNICKITNDIIIPPLSRDEEARYNEAVYEETQIRNAQHPARRAPHTISNLVLKQYFERIAGDN